MYEKDAMGQQVFFTKGSAEFANGMLGFSLNQAYLFFWNDFNIWYLNIKEEP